MGALTAVDDETPLAMDPVEARRQAVDAGLVLQRGDPLNCETPISALIGGVLVPNARFYVRNHFQIPRLDPSTWRLRVDGLVEHPLSVSLEHLRRLPSRSLIVTLECAGNGRSLLNPQVEGEPWGLGAVSTAEWAGVPLVEVLDRASLKPVGQELVFRGADCGRVAGRTDRTYFERSLGLEEARNSQALLAYAMNGEPLPIEHGYPLRLIVPDRYGVASVKWLTGIEVLDQAFGGYFQSQRYFYEWDRSGQPVREPVTRQRVRALITEPHPDQAVAGGELAVRGVAWSGAAPIARVEVSIGGGAWQEARLDGEPRRHVWQRWELITRVQRSGRITIRARATDLAGGTQPQQPEWNRLGYGSNAIQEVAVQVRP